MKAVQLFIKEHVPLVLFQCGLLGFILLLYWLDGFRDVYTAIYAFILGIVFTFAFLLAKYILRRNFYTKIVEKPAHMEDLLIRHSTTPEHLATTQFMRKSYRLYQGEVQQLYAAQSRQLHFINQWVHQMKTPISVTSLLLQQEEINVKSIQEELDKMQRGLEAVLVHARLDTFEEDMRIEAVPLRQLVQGVISEHKRLFITNGVFPVVDIDESIVVATDVKWIKIVFAQFVTNAVKYTFEKGKKVYFSAEQTAEKVSFSVRDEGIGIPQSDINRIKKPFFTGENGRLTGESTGMGLYIAAEVCERLGHTFHVDSEVGVGTTMTIDFTVERKEERTDGEKDSREITRNHENLRE